MFVPEERKANKVVRAGKAGNIPRWTVVGWGSYIKCSLLGQGKSSL